MRQHSDAKTDIKGTFQKDFSTFYSFLVYDSCYSGNAILKSESSISP